MADLAVTAVVVTAHRPRQVREAIASILDQRYDGEIEVLVVFDGMAPDHSLEGKRQDRPVRVLSNRRAPGVQGARNTGILQARGELIAICDDDDLWLPNRLARGADELARSPECDVVVGPIRLRYDEHEVERGFGKRRILLADLLRDRIVAAHSSTILARRRTYDDVGLVDEQVPDGYAEDYDWLLRAARRKPIAFLQGPPVAVIDRTGSMFADWQGIDRGIEYMLRKHPEFAHNRRGLARMLGRRALCHAAVGDRREALRFAVGALRRNPADRRAAISIPVALGALSADRIRSMGSSWGRTA